MITLLQSTVGQDIINFLQSSGIYQMFVADGGWKCLVMLALACFLLYLAIKKQYEPLLLLPIAFGMLLTNLPGAGMFHSEIFADGHIDWAALSTGHAGPHGLQGIGANFGPDNLERSLIDEVFPVTEAQAYEAARTLARCEGVLAGISSGAALHAAIEIAKRPGSKGKVLAVILPDTGERYLSTPLLSET